MGESNERLPRPGTAVEREDLPAHLHQRCRPAPHDPGGIAKARTGLKGRCVQNPPLKRMILFFVFVSILFLFSCNRTGQPAEDATITTPLEHPATVIASPSPASLKTTDTPLTYPDPPIVYYYFVAIKSNTFPAGSVVILPDVLVLGPTLSEIARTHDAVMDIGSALQAMLNDPRNEWSSTGIGITSITINEGAASVVLQGEFSATGDIVLIAARYQTLLTVFAEQSVQTA